MQLLDILGIYVSTEKQGLGQYAQTYTVIDSTNLTFTQIQTQSCNKNSCKPNDVVIIRTLDKKEGLEELDSITIKHCPDEKTAKELLTKHIGFSWHFEPELTEVICEE